MTNAPRVLKLSVQYVHMVNNIGKTCHALFIYRTYVLEMEQDTNLSLSKTWNLLHDAGDPLPEMPVDKLYEALLYLESTSSSVITVEIIKHEHKLMMHN